MIIVCAPEYSTTEVDDISTSTQRLVIFAMETNILFTVSALLKMLDGNIEIGCLEPNICSFVGGIMNNSTRRASNSSYSGLLRRVNIEQSATCAVHSKVLASAHGRLRLSVHVRRRPPWDCSESEWTRQYSDEMRCSDEIAPQACFLLD